MRSELSRLHCRVAVIVLLMVLLAGMPSLAAEGSPSGYQLGAGDRISVVVSCSPEFDTATRIRDDGTIGFPYLGAVRVSGLTVPQAEKHLATRLRREEILKHPQVSVTVEEYLSRQVTVLGNVQNPGKYGLSGPTTVLDLLARTGGSREEAADHVVLVRTVEGERRRYRMSFNDLAMGSAAGTQVRDGDVVIVPRMQTFFIEGAVNKPGQYRLEENMTVMKAIAAGGGLIPRGSYDRTVFKREADNGEL
jgi:polysaccharide export outer membrane protein